MQESVFNLTNVKCAGCVSKVQAKVNSIPGVVSAKVNLLDKTLFVKYNAAKQDDEVVKLLGSIGYGASLEKINEEKLNIYIGVVLPILVAFIIMLLTMNNYFAIDYHDHIGIMVEYLYALGSLALLFVSGHKVIRLGYIGFRSGALNMYSLVLLGVGSAWVYSFGAILMMPFLSQKIMPHIYFDSSLMIIGLINLGAYLEEKAKVNTTNAIKTLVNLVPEKTVVIVNNIEDEIDTNLLRTDYLVKIKPGSRVPADGVIVSGDGYLDESMLTGESIPIYKTVGLEVVGGSINTSGSFVFKVTKIGDNTLLSGIIKLVKNAQLSKPNLAKLADKVAAVFVPIIIAVALFSAMIWYALSVENPFYSAITVFMTVLLIACPCSVGLAIPVSLVVGVGRAASKGILIRDPSCLSVVDKVSVILLDKTGTITEGKPKVINLIITDGYEENKLFEILYALEKNSEHPFANAVVEYCLSKISTLNIVVEEFCSIAGHGVSGVFEGEKFYVGSRDFMLSIGFSANLLIGADSLYSQVYLASNNKILLSMDISDKIKEDSLDAIKQLKASGARVAMVTGDQQSVAENIASSLGIDEVYANYKPHDKIDLVQNFQENGNVVVFVGDGINDAPSLMKSDIGIAIGGADIAHQSASISLLRNSLFGVCDTLTLSHKINKNMQQNLFGSFFYNLIAVAIAAGVLYPICGILLNPMIATLVMSVSSITVILNSLRLRNA